MSFECLDCEEIGDGYCSDCATPNDDLREFVDQIRTNHEHLMERDDSYAAGAIGMQEAILNQLEDLIDDS